MGGGPRKRAGKPVDDCDADDGKPPVVSSIPGDGDGDLLQQRQPRIESWAELLVVALLGWCLMSFRFNVIVAEYEPKPSKLVLSYFDARGRAEAVRVALHDHGVAFEDDTFSVRDPHVP